MRKIYAMEGAHRPFLAAARLLSFVVLTLAFLPGYSLFLALGRTGVCASIARRYWRAVAWIIGIRIKISGTPSAAIPTLYASNHASYFDIIILGSALRASFVAKREVRQWPGFGVIAQLGRTVFIDRRRGKSKEQRDEMIARSARDSLILFPEGTSNDGNRVLPFKSALFSVAEDAGIPVQPVSIAYVALDGMPVGRSWRPYFAWYGDMDLAPHLWEALGLGRLEVALVFHDVVSPEKFASRKELSDYCQKQVQKGVVWAHANA